MMMTIQRNDIFFGYFFSVVAETTDGSLLVCGVTLVGQLQVPKTLTFKMRPRATPSSVYEFYLHVRPGGTWEWSIQCLRLLI